MDLAYPASRGERLRFGYLARKVQPTSPPRRLAKSFADAVNLEGMSQPNRGMGKRRQEEWMEGDLLGGELGKERDLRIKL